MAVVLTHQRKSRLSAMIDQPGGVSVGVALTQAKVNLETLQARGQAIVLARIADLAALQPPTPGDQAARRLQQAYDLSSAVIDAAGPFELADLCAAAAGLCDLIDAASPAEKLGDHAFDWRIVTVHARSMQLILALPPEAIDARAQVLGSLKQVLTKKIPAAQQN